MCGVGWEGAASWEELFGVSGHPYCPVPLGLLPIPAPIYLEEKAHRLSRAWCLKDSTHSTISLSCLTAECSIHCSLHVVIEAAQGVLPCRDVTISTKGNLGLVRSLLKSHPQELSSVFEKEKGS